MSTNKTQHLNLHSWVKTDEFKMEEFNENFSAIDAAVRTNAEAAAALEAAKAEIAAGTYTGDGAREREITLGRQPKAVLVRPAQGETSDSIRCWGGLALPGTPVTFFGATSYNTPALTVTDAGFKVYYVSYGNTYICSNQNGVVYTYLAIF